MARSPGPQADAVERVGEQPQQEAHQEIRDQADDVDGRQNGEDSEDQNDARRGNMQTFVQAARARRRPPAARSY